MPRIAELVARLGLPQRRIVVVLLVMFALGVACHVASGVWLVVGVQAMGVRLNTRLLAENGRYFEVTRDRYPRVIEEISADQYERRSAHHRVETWLIAAAPFLMIGPMFTYIAYKQGIFFKR